jgi:PAS domain S-box-containing protein
VLEAERERVEEVWGEAEPEKATILDSLNEMVIFQDLEHRVQWANRIAGESVSLPSEELVGRYCYDVWGRGGQACPGCPVAKARKTGKPQAGEMTTRDGRVWLVRGYPIRDANGDVSGLVEMAMDITERKRVVAELQEQKNKLQSLVGAMEDGLTVQDKGFNIIYQNHPLIEDYGDRLGEKCYRVYEGRNSVCDSCPVEKAFNDGKSHTTERKVTLPSGEVVFGEVKASPVRDARGRIVSCLEIIRNITERKQAEKELRESEERFRSIVENSQVGILILDDAHHIRYANDEMCRISGYSRDEAIGQDFRKFLDKESRQLVNGRYRRRQKGEAVTPHYEFSFITKDGQKRRVETSASVIRNAAGEARTVAQILDVTERKQTEVALQEERNKLKSVISAMEDGLTIQDRDFNIIYQNEASRQASGGDRIGEKCYRAYENRDEVCDGCPVEKAFNDGKSHTTERRGTGPSGEVIFWENTANPIRDAKGRIISCLELSRDITERKKAEEKLADELTRRRILVDQSRDGIVVLDDKGKVYEANQRFADMLGYTYQEAQELSVWDWEYQFPREQVAEMIRTVDETGDHFETRHRRKDGSTFDVEISTNGAVCAGKKLIFCVCRDITERKRSEEELRQSEARLAEAQSLAYIGSWELDIASNTLTWSDEVYRIFGLRPQQFGATYEAFLENIHPDDREMVNKAYTESVKTKTPYSIVHRLLLKDGTVKYVNETGETFYDDEGKPIRSIGTVQDITERKQAEAALLEAEEKYKKLIEAASDLIWEANEEGWYTFVSPRIKDLLGYEVEEVVGKKRTLDFAPKKEARKWLKSFKKVNAKRVPFSGFEILHHHKNGNPVIFEVSGIPLFDGTGNFKGYVGINKDITERKQVTEALKENQEFSTGLLENSPNPKSVLNPDTSIRYVNPAFEKLTGYKLSEIAGMKAPYPWWPKKGHKEMTQNLKKAMASGGKRSEHVFRKRNGEPFWVMLNSAPVIHRKKLLYFLINWIDITEHKRAEEEKAELEQKAHLASRLASVGEMASGIAHEINNPLTAVIGFAQLLMDNDLPEEIKEDLTIIHKEAQRAAGVARNLLTFARKHAPSKQLTNINGIIEGVLTLRAYEQNVSNIQINTKLVPNLPEVMADYPQLQQVFINIILNAEAAMLEASNGGTLTITTRKFDHSVRASFADDGPGIAKENLNRIFDPFFTTKEVGKGTGLGLSVCHGIIAEHGGKIYARSKPGKGATFIVELPIASEEQAEEPDEAN